MIPYKLVPEGKGKSFIQDADRFPVIGTHGCITCVGVYFKINDESCFLAHISAVVMYGGKQPKWKRRACTPGEGARVKAVSFYIIGANTTPYGKRRRTLAVCKSYNCAYLNANILCVPTIRQYKLNLKKLLLNTSGTQRTPTSATPFS